MKNDSKSLYGIHDKTERQLLIGYNSLISISCLIGDTLILIGSLRYKAIKLHKVLVIFIQYIAVNDLLFTVFSILPGTISLAADDWILGDTFCFLNYIAKNSSAQFICLAISALALAKMVIVKNPLRAIHFSGQAAHLTACCIWVYSFIFPIAAISRDKDGVYFSYKIYNCIYDRSIAGWNPIGFEIYDIVVGLSVLTTTVVIVVSSVMLMVIARRVADRMPRGLQWPGVLAVFLTVAAHIVITLPLVIFYIISCYYHQSSTTVPMYLHRMFRWGWNIASLGAVVNFYIYTLTLSSFREFLKSRMKMITTLLIRCYTASEDERSVEEGEERRLL